MEQQGSSGSREVSDLTTCNTDKNKLYEYYTCAGSSMERLVLPLLLHAHTPRSVKSLSLIVHCFGRYAVGLKGVSER